MSLSPQCAAVLNHIKKAGSITGVEAEQVHRIRHLPSRVFELKRAGYNIKAETHKDVVGQRYVRYSLMGQPKSARQERS